MDFNVSPKMYTFIAPVILSCVFLLSAQAQNTPEGSVLNRFLALKDPSSPQALADIYHSMMEIDRSIAEDPSYDISVIGKWRDKVDQILKAQKMQPLLAAARLDQKEAVDFDMLARSIWFAKDFRFTSEDRQLLRLLKASTLAQTKD